MTRQDFACELQLEQDAKDRLGPAGPGAPYAYACSAELDRRAEVKP